MHAPPPPPPPPYSDNVLVYSSDDHDTDSAIGLITDVLRHRCTFAKAACSEWVGKHRASCLIDEYEHVHVYIRMYTSLRVMPLGKPTDGQCLVKTTDPVVV